MNSQAISSNNESILQFLALVKQGMECWVKAGEIVAHEIDQNPLWVEAVCKHDPTITGPVILRFEKMGRRSLHPQLSITDAPGAKQLSKLHIALQEKYLNQPVELLVKNGDDWDTLQASVLNLTHDQARQVFSSDGIRTPSAQRLYLEDCALKKALPVVESMPTYRIVGKKLVITKDCTLTAKELARILVDME